MTGEKSNITRTEFVQECALCGGHVGTPSESHISIIMVPERVGYVLDAHLECLSKVLMESYREGFDQWREERGQRRAP